MKSAGIVLILLLGFIGCAYAQPNITAAEYFVDVDPGPGNGTSISISTGTTIDIPSLNIPTTALAAGWHTVCVRTKNANNVWGFYECRKIYLNPIITIPPVAPVTTMEYFYDNVTDPGTGQSIVITTGTTVDVPTISLPNTLSLGWHTLHVRTKDQNNVWGFYESRSIFVRPVSAVTNPPPPPITSMEYFYDNVTVPGTGQTIAITSGSAVDIPGVSLPCSLPTGWHTIHVRTKDQNNIWGMYESRSIFVRPSVIVTNPPPSPITRLEYYYDNVTDPGTGQAIAISSGTSIDVGISNLASGLAHGWHNIAVRSQNQSNEWGFYENRTIFVNSNTIPASIPPSPIVQFEYFIDSDPGAGLSSFTLTKPPATLIDLPAEPLNVGSLSLGPHTIGLRAKDQNGTWSPAEQRSFTVAPGCTVTTPPTAGNVTRCDPGSVSIMASGATGAQVYRWYPDNTTLVFLFAGSPFVTPPLSVNTDYFVSIYDPTTYCESARTQVTAIVTGIPKPALNLTGSLNVCQGNSVTLVAPPGFTTYAWSNGLTTPQITVATSGSYSVIVGNGTCLSPVSDQFVFTVNPNPAKPIINATGGGSLCGTGSVTLSAPPGFVAYSWSSGQSTQSIVVNAIGNFTATVTDVNGCQSQTSDIFSVTSSAIPKPLITVTGSTLLCGVGSVQLTAPAGFPTYAWSTGDVTQTITVSVGGSYTVWTANGSCTSPVSDPVVVTALAIPTKPTISVTGTTALCNGAFSVLSSPAGFSNYLWSDGETTRQIVVSAPGSFSVQVGNASGCMSIASDPVAITITGLSCGGGGIPSVPSATGASRCGTGTVSLNASGAVTGQVYRWYDDPLSGTLVFTGNPFTTASLSSTSTFYVSIYDPGTTGESNRSAVTATIVNIAAPVITGSSAVSICAGSSTLLSGPLGFVQYLWSSGATTQQIQVGTAGNYSVQVGDGTCLSPPSNTIAVSIVPAIVKPVVTTPGSTMICGTGTVQLSAPAGFIYAWSNGETSQNINVSLPGNYSVAISNGTCTSPSSDPVSVILVNLAKPVVTPIGSQTICSGSSVTLTAPSGFSQYLWSNGATTQQVQPTTADNYSVQVGNGACLSPSSDLVTVEVSTVPPKPVISITGSTTFCSQGSVDLSGPAGFIYQWSNGATTQTITLTESAVISLVIKSPAGCVSPSSDPLVITKLLPPCKPNTPPFILPIALSAKIEGSVTADLTKYITDAEDNIDYTSLHTLTNSTEIGAPATIDGSYILTIDYKGIPYSGHDRITLEVLDLYGLRAQRIIDIEVVGEVVVFNGITPDGNGVNDFFYIQYLDVIQGGLKNKVTIFNRWGDIVFDIANYNNVDRVFTGIGNNGNMLSPGTYFYRIDLSEGKPVTGYITLKP